MHSRCSQYVLFPLQFNKQQPTILSKKGVPTTDFIQSISKTVIPRSHHNWAVQLGKGYSREIWIRAVPYHENIHINKFHFLVNATAITRFSLRVELGDNWQIWSIVVGDQGKKEG